MAKKAYIAITVAIVVLVVLVSFFGNVIIFDFSQGMKLSVRTLGVIGALFLVSLGLGIREAESLPTD